MRHLVYTVIDDKTGKVVKKGKASELEDYFNVTSIALYAAFRMGYLFQEKYRVGAYLNGKYKYFYDDKEN